MLRLKNVRIDKGQTQKEVAVALGIGKTTYTNYENEERKIPPEMLVKVADYFDVSVDYLLGRKVSAPSVTQKGMYQLTDEEFDLVDAYRDSTEEDKQFIMNVAKVSQVKGNTMFVAGVLDNLNEALKEEKKEAVL